MCVAVLPMFVCATPAQTKRSSSGGATAVLQRGGDAGAGRAQLSALLHGLREPTALAMAVSLLARLYNVLRDEPGSELQAPHLALWPAVLSNAAGYSASAVAELLAGVAQRALRMSARDGLAAAAPWHRVLADLAYAAGRHEAALRGYLQAALHSTDHFHTALDGAGALDEHAVRRMARCCSSINCHTQAAVLTQLLEEGDYQLAFKCLSESKTLHACYDSVDAYYGCIWDPTLLEYLVHLHHKRAEHQRRQQAVRAIGQLELNHSNGEEIRREAMAARKARFLRALAKQFLSNAGR